MNIGLIGCGRVAQIHLCAYRNIPEAKVVAVSDLNLDRARSYAKEYRIKHAFGDYVKVFEMDNLDYVDICTPTSTHANIACEAANYGHNILLEKPMARSTKECDSIIHDVSKHGVKLCVCHNQIFIPNVVSMKKTIESGAFDLIRFYTSVKEDPKIFGPAINWVTKPENGGILWESGLHLAYLQLHFLKGVTEVTAVGSKIRYPVHDSFSVLLRTATNAIGVLEVSLFAKRPEALYEFTSSEGNRMQIIDYNLLSNLSENPSSFLRGLYLDAKTSLKRWAGPMVNRLRMGELLICMHHHQLISQFMQSIKSDIAPPVSPEDGRNTIMLLECIEESLETGKPVRVKKSSS